MSEEIKEIVRNAKAIKRSENVGLEGRLKFTLFDENDNVIHEHEQKNLILDTGLTIWPQILNGAKNPTIVSIKVGTSATAPIVTQTGVITILSQDNAPLKEIGTTTITYHALIGPSVTGTIAEVGLYIDSIGVARQLVSPAIVMQGLRRCAIEWTWVFQRAA